MKKSEKLSNAEMVSNNREKYLTGLVVFLGNSNSNEEYRALLSDLNQLKKLNYKITKNEISFFKDFNDIKRRIGNYKAPPKKKVIKGPIAYPSKMKMDAEKVFNIIKRKNEISALDLRKDTNLPPVRIYSILTQLMKEVKVTRKIEGRTYLYSVNEINPRF